MVKTLLWDVDTQLDFMEPEGKLPVPGSESIRPAISRLTNLLPRTYIISGSVDAHTPRDQEFRLGLKHYFTSKIINIKIRAREKRATNDLRLF